MLTSKTQIESEIKSSKSAAVKSNLIDQEVIFPCSLKIYYSGQIWALGPGTVSQIFGTGKLRRRPAYLN